MLCSRPGGVGYIGLARRSIFGWPQGGSKEEKAERRKKLKEELDKGYVSELKEYRLNKGKRFHAENGLLAREKAVKFPQVQASSLSGESFSLPPSHTALVLLSMRGSGMETCDQYREVMEEEFCGKVPVLELSLLEKKVFIWLQSWITRNLKKSIPANRHDSFLLCTGSVVSELRQTLDVHNSFVGYVYLLDRQGLIRWRAHGVPSPQELRTMASCTHKLLSF